jgi:protein-disulfide isomerase
MLARSTARMMGPWLATACRLALAGVWLWAGLAKILDPEGAVRAVTAYRLPGVGIRQVGAQATSRGVTSTPTIFVNGQPLSRPPSPDELVAAVEAASP